MGDAWRQMWLAIAHRYMPGTHPDDWTSQQWERAREYAALAQIEGDAIKDAANG